MQTKEELIAKFKALRLRQQEAVQGRLRSAEEHGIQYSADYRPENLRLLRALFNAKQASFAPLLGMRNQKQYSLIETGDQPLSPDAAREIERELGIPENWLDRNNSNSLFLSQDEPSLVNEIRGVKPEAALKLAETVKLLSGRSS
jgi:transcriptional regulator with XRE-family HTH domain